MQSHSYENYTVTQSLGQINILRLKCLSVFGCKITSWKLFSDFLSCPHCVSIHVCNLSLLSLWLWIAIHFCTWHTVLAYESYLSSSLSFWPGLSFFNTFSSVLPLLSNYKLGQYFKFCCGWSDTSDTKPTCIPILTWLGTGRPASLCHVQPWLGGDSGTTQSKGMFLPILEVKPQASLWG